MKTLKNVFFAMMVVVCLSVCTNVYAAGIDDLYAVLDRMTDENIAVDEEHKKLYTEASYGKLEEAMGKVAIALGADATEDQINEATTALEEALANLEVRPADYSEVINLLREYNKLNKDNYTEESYKAFMDAFDSNKLNLPITRQSEVDEMATNMQNALDNLVPLDADYTELYALFDEIVELQKNKDIYTEESFEHLMSFVDGSLLGLTILDQDKIDEAVVNIREAIDALEVKSADYSEVTSAVEKANQVDKTKYTEESYNALMEAVNKVVYDLDVTSQSDVDKMAEEIKTALDNLVPLDADYSELFELFDKIVELKENEEIYTEESFDHLMSFVDASLLDLTILDQDKIDEAVENIKEAIDALEVKSADYSKVNSAVEKANQVDKTKYTEESYKALMEAVNKVVYDLDITSQSDVDKMAEEIETAYAKLVSVPTVETNDVPNNAGNNPQTGFNTFAYYVSLVASLIGVAFTVKKKAN